MSYRAPHLSSSYFGPITFTLTAVLVLIYGAGYASIRTHCESVGPGTVIVPPYVCDSGRSTTLGKFYKPLFVLENRCTGRYFTWGAWAGSNLNDL